MPSDYSFIQETIYVIGHNETSGDYSAVNATDVVSVGIFQWYGSRAYDLCYTIYYALGSETADAILDGTNISADLQQNNSSLWSNWTPDATERAALSNLISTDTGIKNQNDLATSDSWSYIKTGQNYGLTNGAALIYFADLYNQSPRQAINILSAAGGAVYANNLQSLHNAAMRNSVMNRYATRRNWTYNELNAWSGETETPPPSGGGGWIGGDIGINSHDYIINCNGVLVLYSQTFPEGRIYLPTNTNIFYPKNS